MKTIKVAAAIIKKDNKILIASRKTGEFAGMFEFPGGKVEPGETSKQALIREIQEELETSINIDEFFINVNYTYPTFILDMDCFICLLGYLSFNFDCCVLYNNFFNNNSIQTL